ncbi:MAG: hypothetical protein R3202_07860, partial [Candidatus Competibacterales bacterium]|nr:hypothetical protein [Candidatus Competibacterales bacterium]
MKRLFLGSTLLLLLGLLTQTAAARTITAAHTGAWYDPGLSGQGFNFEILRPVTPGGPKRFLAFWYTYEDDGSEAPTWAVGNTGIVPGEPVIQVVMERPISSLPAAPMEAVATIEFEFFGCDQARAEVLSGLHAGRVYQLARLTEILAQPCSGGISDDADPYGPAIEIERALIPTALAPAASGEVELEIRTGEARFKVEIEDLPINDYALCVDGEYKVTIPVSDDGDGDIEGEIEFESPQDDQHPLLDFDPSESLIEITDSATDCAAPVLLFVDLAQAPGNDDDDDDGNDDDGNDDDEGPPSGERQEWEAELDNLGVFGFENAE